MPRASMAALIAKVSLLVYDPTNTVFTTDQVQAALDRRRETWRQGVLTPQPTRRAGGLDWLDYYAGDPADPITDWETDETLYDYTFTAISAAAYTADELTGHWTFSSSQLLPVYLTGKTYDIYAAAADLCEIRAALTSDQYNMSNQGQSLARGQVPQNWRALAATYRRQQRLGGIAIVRSDVSDQGALGDLWVAQHTINRGRP